MKIKEKIKGIFSAFVTVFRFFILLFLICWIGCFFYSAVKLVVQSVKYTGHSVGEIVGIERWMGLDNDGDAYNFNMIMYRYSTEDGRIMIGKEDTNSRKTNAADIFVEEVRELNPEIWVGGGQKIFYDPDEPQKVISEYSRRNLKMLCLLTVPERSQVPTAFADRRVPAALTDLPA